MPMNYFLSKKSPASFSFFKNSSSEYKLQASNIHRLHAGLLTLNFLYLQEYKPPASHDIPEDFRTTFYDSKRMPAGVLGSKATGEPSMLMGFSAAMAIRQAVRSAKKDLGEDPKTWFNLCKFFNGSSPASCSVIFLFFTTINTIGTYQYSQIILAQFFHSIWALSHTNQHQNYTNYNSKA